MTKYEFGDIVLVEFIQTGMIQRKKRPAAVILDIGDADVILAPITTKERTSLGDYKLRDWKESGLVDESWLRLAKISCLEKSDITKTLGKLTEYDKKKIMELWQTIFSLE